MIKRGFTITELLVALAIIGVVSALMIPKLANISPDRNKMIVLKKYNMITSAVNGLLDNQELYYSLTITEANNADLGQPDCQGLSCTHTPLNHKYSGNPIFDESTVTPLIKFVNLFADITNGTVDGTTINYDDNTSLVVSEINNANNVVHFVNNANYSDVIFQMDLCLDKNTCNTDSVYDANNNTNPKKFAFYIDRYGSILAGDALTAAHLLDNMSVKASVPNAT